MSKEELIEKINAIAPLLVTLVGCVNAFLTLRGLPNIDLGNETITVCVSSIATVVGEIWSWWCNNNWTKKAQTSQPVLNLLKEDKITTQQVNEFIESAQQEKVI